VMGKRKAKDAKLNENEPERTSTRKSARLEKNEPELNKQKNRRNQIR